MSKSINQGPKSDSIIGCGMYAFTPFLRKAWTKFFQHAGQCHRVSQHSVDNTFCEIELNFSPSNALYFSEKALLSHTCGYPYLKKWRDSHLPVCIPLFDIDGCDDISYRSWFIRHKRSPNRHLEHFYQSRVAINGWESNSGMNVLRYAISQLAGNSKFFREVTVTGSHFQSICDVAEGRADIAAIDAVSFYFASVKSPKLLDHIEIFDQSAVTVGLPFVQHRNSTIDPAEVTQFLNHAAKSFSDQHGAAFKLTGFKIVDEQAYLPMLELENKAVTAGYPELR
ncbi:MAG: PhnD/SsuA/transferrin family substrate-binding protein [Acidiferrobacterales bacterium]|nr:PhnD/SsuA/transferrin family substrate-binding protein [Acidiferrobacterales bacterium]